LLQSEAVLGDNFSVTCRMPGGVATRRIHAVCFGARGGILSQALK